MYQWFIIVALFFSSAMALAQDKEKLMSYVEGCNALFSGRIAALDIHAVLCSDEEEGNIRGFYFYDKYLEKDMDKNGSYKYRDIKLTGQLATNDNGKLTLTLDEYNDEKLTARMQSEYSESDNKFIGSWRSLKNDKEHAFTLKAGGVLPLYAEPDVKLSMSLGEKKLVLADSTSLVIEHYDLESSRYSEYSFSILEGEPKIYVVSNHNYEARVESSDSYYIVQGKTEPFLKIYEGGGHSCAGMSGGKNRINVAYQSPFFDVTNEHVNWEHCNTENGYYTDFSKKTTMRYTIQKNGEVSSGVQKDYNATFVMAKPEGDAVFIELTDSNIFWGGFLPDDRPGISANYEVFRLGNSPPFDFRCWLYGDGSTQSNESTPTQNQIDPLWRNLSIKKSWEKFVSHTQHGLLDTKTWRFVTDQNGISLSLNDLEVARLDNDNKCYSLYLKDNIDGVNKLVY